MTYNGPIAFKSRVSTQKSCLKTFNKIKTDCFQILYSGEVSEPTYKTMSMTRLTHFCIPKSSKCNVSMKNGPIALKFCTKVQFQSKNTYLG